MVRYTNQWIVLFLFSIVLICGSKTQYFVFYRWTMWRGLFLLDWTLIFEHSLHSPPHRIKPSIDWMPPDRWIDMTWIAPMIASVLYAAHDPESHGPEGSADYMASISRPEFRRPIRVWLSLLIMRMASIQCVWRSLVNWFVFLFYYFSEIESLAVVYLKFLLFASREIQPWSDRADDCEEYSPICTFTQTYKPHTNHCNNNKQLKEYAYLYLKDNRIIQYYYPTLRLPRTPHPHWRTRIFTITLLHTHKHSHTHRVNHWRICFVAFQIAHLLYIYIVKFKYIYFLYEPPTTLPPFFLFSFCKYSTIVQRT